MNLKYWFFTFILTLLIAIASCTSNSPSGSGNSTIQTDPGKKIFSTYCVTCHGVDGKMGLNGAFDLTKSTLNKQETEHVITNGRKMMAPYKAILSPSEISDVTDYVMKFRR